jgi:hypothetical protein
MSRSIDRRRPQRLTLEQSASVKNNPTVQSLLGQPEQFKRTVPNATKEQKYKALTSRITREKQRLRHALLQDFKESWELEQPVRDVERQLAGGDIHEDVEVVHNAMHSAQRELADSVLSNPGTTVIEEVSRRNRAICAVTMYCGLEEGRMNPFRAAKRTKYAAPKVESQSEYEEKALEAAKVLVYKETRPKICFICLGNKTLATVSRIYSFYTPGDLSKHFKRKHLKHAKDKKYLYCRLC